MADVKETKKYLNLAGLSTYNTELLKEVDKRDAEILKQAKEYAADLTDIYDAAGTAQTKVDELKNGAVKTNADAIEKLNGDESIEGSVKKTVKDASDAINNKIGTVAVGKTVVEMIQDAQTSSTYDDTEVKQGIADNKAAIETLNGTGEGSVSKAVGDAKTELDGKIKTNSDAITILNGEDTVVGSVKKAVKDASDALNVKIQANADAIQAHKDAVDEKVTTLVGEDANKSVRTIANEELAAQLLTGKADADFKTLKELAAWLEDHPEEVTAINASIADIKKLIGSLPEDATAKDVVGYIKELVSAEQTRATGVEGGLETRLKTVEGLVGEGGSVDDKIAAAKQAAVDTAAADATAKADKALSDAKTYADEKAATNKGLIDANAEKITANEGEIAAAKTRLDTLESVEYVAITDTEIKALFTPAE